MTAPPNPFDSLVGQAPDGFVILKPVGEGATSTVYQAMESSRDNRLVALKVMDATEQRLIERAGRRGNPFEREARFSRQVKDPGIVRIFKTGQLPDGRYYVAMEFVPGMALEDELRHRGKLPWREAAEVLRQAAGSVGSLHALQIIHRDLKPGNLMVRVTRDNQIRAKLIDFGLAKLEHERDAVVPGADAVLLGTPQYMSPEQAAGEGTSYRSDVYGLGAILYEALAGRPVVDLPRSTPGACLEYLRSPKPLPVTPLDGLVKGAPKALGALVTESLARNPARRPPNAVAFADRVGKVLRNAPPEPEPSRFGRWVSGLFRRR